ncbi:GAP1-N2 domain-containing protein [Frigoriglobus tundricola]|uniref:VWFA domain-containing protein n=1 Tax=Frigoriglobus tundricola TaxID=2774151 RepID=A0A6M5YLP4_9BACT|nr:hypothetical protein [Frigoriglobus tundricola]QJW94504.1 hypothetical protein FTUN_2025 [Frigoriglobus tundricola]
MARAEETEDGVFVGDQYYVTHCAPADSVLNNPGYTVRAASKIDPAALDAAFRYPPYELPIDLWRDPPSAANAPRRLARARHPAGGVWAAHSAYLVKDTVGRDRSYFSHLMQFPAAPAAAVLRSWGADEWVTDYPPGASKALPGNVELPVGALVSDAALTAFLGDSPPGPTELSRTVCPPRLRGTPGERRDLFGRLFLAALVLTEDANRRLYVHAEPGVLALLLYGAVRLLPQSAVADLTFSTYEPAQRDLRDPRLGRVVGTYLGAPGKTLAPDALAPNGLVLDTFALGRSSPELRKPVTESLPSAMKDLIKVVARGEWATVDDIHQFVGGEWDVRSWLEDARVRTKAPPLPPLPDAGEMISLDDPAVNADDALSLDDAPTPPAPAPRARAAGPRRRGGARGTGPRVRPGAPPSRPVGAMTYAAPITRTSPACLLLLIDQSKSMADPFIAGTGQTKAGVVADALNRLIQNVVLRSAKADGVRDYFRVGVLGYGQSVKAGLGGAAPHNVLIPVSQLGAHPLRVETRTKLIPDGVGGVLEQKVKFPVWYDPEASGQTPMCEALAAAGLAVQGFVTEFPDAYPPIVLNLTDGMPSDGNPQYNARLITNQGTRDGATLLFNLLISSKPVAADYFPATEAHLTDVCSKLLFRMSSVLPPKLLEAARAEGHGVQPRARGVVINADPTAIVRFLDIGTRVTPSGK